MRTGKINQSTSGILNAGGWQLLEEYEVTGSGITSYTFSGLNGNVDQEYRIIARVITGSGGGGNEYIRCNNDSAANYGAQRLTGANTTASANRDTDFTGLFFINGNSSGDSNFGDIIIHSKSGYVRTAIATSINRIAGTTVTQIVKVGSSWNNTSDNITSLTIVSGVSGGLGIGTHLFLFKRNLLGTDATSGIKTGDLNVQGAANCGIMQKIYQTTLSSAATSITISGLDGNTDILYELKIKFVGGSSAESAYYILINNDSGSNYGHQRLYGTSTSIAATRVTSATGLRIGGANKNNISQSEINLYAKSGYIRTVLSNWSFDITGTTVNGIFNYGHSWNNTADNITSLVVTASQANGLGIGTVIELWALRKKL